MQRLVATPTGSTLTDDVGFESQLLGPLAVPEQLCLDPAKPPSGSLSIEVGAGQFQFANHSAQEIFVDTDVVESLRALSAGLAADDTAAGPNPSARSISTTCSSNAGCPEFVAAASHAAWIGAMRWRSYKYRDHLCSGSVSRCPDRRHEMAQLQTGDWLRLRGAWRLT